MFGTCDYNCDYNKIIMVKSPIFIVIVTVRYKSSIGNFVP